MTQLYDIASQLLTLGALIQYDIEAKILEAPNKASSFPHASLLSWKTSRIFCRAHLAPHPHSLFHSPHSGQETFTTFFGVLAAMSHFSFLSTISAPATMPFHRFSCALPGTTQCSNVHPFFTPATTLSVSLSLSLHEKFSASTIGFTTSLQKRAHVDISTGRVLSNAFKGAPYPINIDRR